MYQVLGEYNNFSISFFLFVLECSSKREREIEEEISACENTSV